MAMPARLITPDGKTIELSPETYKQVRKLLAGKYIVAPTTKRVAAIRATFGKYAGKPSLTKALLKERKAEYARENSKLRRHNG